jgi:DNA topoisomerase VI subunit B
MALTNKLNRTSFSTNRSLDYFSRKELIAQVGHSIELWPVVILKELVDNAIDACEEASQAPVVNVAVTSDGITAHDNGPGISPESVTGICDFNVRQSSREAYVAPDRGAQGNAFKTLLAMPFVVTGEPGRVVITSCGIRHEIAVEADNVRQEPVITHNQTDVADDGGMKVFVGWPSRPDGESDEWIGDDEPASMDLACSIAAESKLRFLQIADDFVIINPHLTLSVKWHDEPVQITEATDATWRKWRPNQPTSSHWYQDEHLGRLIAAYLSHDEGHGRERTVREFISEFDGLTGSAKQKKVLESTGMARDSLSVLSNGRGLQMDRVANLLKAMQDHTKPVKPTRLGPIGKDHIRQQVEAMGAKMESFKYTKVLLDEVDGVPWIIETAFAWCPESDRRRLVSGVNWSPGILNPFRTLGGYGRSLESVLSNQRATSDEPVVFLLHAICPRVEYTDRGKSAIVISK